MTSCLALLIQSILVIHVLKPIFPLPYPSRLHACLPFWVAYITLSFFSSFLASFSLPVCLTNKTIQFHFHDYIALISLSCWSTLLDHEIFSFIVLPLFLSELVLSDVGFLKAHLSTSLSPSTSTPYLGYRLESILSTWRLACLNGKFSRWQSWEYINVPWSPDLASGSTLAHSFSLRQM